MNDDMNDNHTTTPLQLNRRQAQCMALAGLLQSCELVRQLATTGQANAFQVRPLLHSLFAFDPDNSVDIYVDLRLLEQGFNRLYHAFDQNMTPIDRDVLQYALNILQITKLLMKRDDHLNIIQSRLSQLDYDPSASSNDNWLLLPPSIDKIYKVTISQLSQRVQIKGDKNHLTNDLTSARIRTLLLTGVRAGMLWYQLGGSKWSLLFKRSDFKKTIKTLSPINP